MDGVAAPMTLDYFIPRLVSWLTFLANAIVFAAAIQFYQQRARRSVLLIAISAGLGVVISIVSWMAETSSKVFWTLIELGGALDLVLWATGICLLFRELAKNEKPDA
jgi:glucose-6-phosphate-specific signal transduction histidine kinase